MTRGEDAWQKSSGEKQRPIPLSMLQPGESLLKNAEPRYGTMLKASANAGDVKEAQELALRARRGLSGGF